MLYALKKEHESPLYVALNPPPRNAVSSLRGGTKLPIGWVPFGDFFAWYGVLMVYRNLATIEEGAHVNLCK